MNLPFKSLAEAKAAEAPFQNFAPTKDNMRARIAELERENAKLRAALVHADLRLREMAIRDSVVMDALQS